MNYKVGDKVSFLNEKGSGVVSKIINKSTVAVTIEDGFEIPFLVEELFIIVEHDDVKITKAPLTSTQQVVEKRPQAIYTNKEKKGIYLAFAPEREDDIANSNFNVWLINNTAYQLLYTFSAFKNGQYQTLASGRIEKSEKFLVETMERHLLSDYSGFKIDALFYQEEEHEEQKPLSELIKLKPVKFYKENVFKDNYFIPEKAMIVQIPFGEEQEQYAQPLSGGGGRMTIKKQKGIVRQDTRAIRQDEMEVDLHIEELLNDYSGMSSYEMMQVQLNAFQKALDEAMSRHCKKLIVIHGVGTGKLKTEIRNLLQGYTHVDFYDGPYAKYGFGATVVEIRNF